jgi:hypothetical protein
MFIVDLPQAARVHECAVAASIANNEFTANEILSPN